MDNANQPPKMSQSGKGFGTDQIPGWYVNDDDKRYYFEGTFIDPLCNLSTATENERENEISTKFLPSEWQIDSMSKSAINYQLLPNDQMFKPAAKGEYYGFGLSENEYKNETLIKSMNAMETLSLPTGVCKFFTMWNNQTSDACTNPAKGSLLNELMQKAKSKKRYSDSSSIYNCNILQSFGNISQKGFSNKVNIDAQCEIKKDNLGLGSIVVPQKKAETPGSAVAISVSVVAVVVVVAVAVVVVVVVLKRRNR